MKYYAVDITSDPCIREIDVRDPVGGHGYLRNASDGKYFYRFGKDAFLTRGEAEKDARQKLLVAAVTMEKALSDIIRRLNYVG